MFEIGVRWNDQSAVTANALPKLYTFGSTRTLEPNPDSKIHVRINLFDTSIQILHRCVSVYSLTYATPR